LLLNCDPGSAAAVSSLLKLAETRSHFQGLDRLPTHPIERRLEIYTSNCNLEVSLRNTQPTHQVSSRILLKVISADNF
jgi:hypothetical protein